MRNETKLLCDDNLYDKLEKTLKDIYFDVHAIYEPDGDGPYGDCYMAAVDLFVQGITFQIFFKHQADEKLTVEYVERWRFG